MRCDLAVVIILIIAALICATAPSPAQEPEHRARVMAQFGFQLGTRISTDVMLYSGIAIRGKPANYGAPAALIAAIMVIALSSDSVTGWN